MTKVSKGAFDYSKEQVEVFDKVWSILSRSLSNRHEFYLSDMDKDVEMQQKLLDLAEDIQKYYDKTGGLKKVGCI
jgi:hypothetical protein